LFYENNNESNPLNFRSLISTNKVAESIWRAKRNKN